jgi:hypothetical protein
MMAADRVRGQSGRKTTKDGKDTKKCNEMFLASSIMAKPTKSLAVVHVHSPPPKLFVLLTVEIFARREDL